MQYPLISEYVRAIQDASDNLGELAHLVPVLDDHGEPYRSSGAFAVVFKMKDEQTGKCYALKCFTEEQEGRAEAYRQIADELEFVDSSYITSVKYLDKEIFVDSSCEEDEFPVLLMDWIDGETMESYIAENYQDNYAMAMLCYRFCKMTAWLRSQPFAHGDIKPDNIMARPDGNLTLVDYDGMFVPAMKGQKSPTIGTKDFSHPLRTVDDFDETIDDFALASIALSLKAISLKPSLLDEYGAADRLLFSAEDYRDLSKSKVLAALQELIVNNDVLKLLALFYLACSQKNLSWCSFPLLSVNNVKEQNLSLLNTDVTKTELDNAIEDEYGVKYSKDGFKLLSASMEIDSDYQIREGTKIICDGAFHTCQKVKILTCPNSVLKIGFMAFAFCSSLERLKMSNQLTSIGAYAFENCYSLNQIELPSTLHTLGANPFAGWKGKLIIKTDSFQYIKGALYSKDMTKLIAYLGNLPLFVVPSQVFCIGESAFACKKVEHVILPIGLKVIEKQAFFYCTHLAILEISNHVMLKPDSLKGCNSFSNEFKQEIISRFGKEVFGE